VSALFFNLTLPPLHYTPLRPVPFHSPPSVAMQSAHGGDRIPLAHFSFSLPTSFLVVPDITASLPFAILKRESRADVFSRHPPHLPPHHHHFGHLYTSHSIRTLRNDALSDLPDASDLSDASTAQPHPLSPLSFYPSRAHSHPLPSSHSPCAFPFNPLASHSHPLWTFPEILQTPSLPDPTRLLPIRT
jgi:hypothetical protein